MGNSSPTVPTDSDSTIPSEYLNKDDITDEYTQVRKLLVNVCKQDDVRKFSKILTDVNKTTPRLLDDSFLSWMTSIILKHKAINVLKYLRLETSLMTVKVLTDAFESALEEDILDFYQIKWLLNFGATLNPEFDIEGVVDHVSSYDRQRLLELFSEFGIAFGKESTVTISVPADITDFEEFDNREDYNNDTDPLFIDDVSSISTDIPEIVLIE